MTMKECPICGVFVKVANLERHLGKQHPAEKVDLGSILTEDEKREAVLTKPRPRSRLAGRYVGILAAVSIFAVAVVILALLLPPGSVGPAVGTDVGQIAPDFTLQTTDGSYASLASFRGKPLLLAFIDVDGPPCQEECSILSSVYANYSSQVHFFSIDVDMIPPADDVGKVNDFRTSKNTPWPYALDPDAAVRNAYHISTRPCVFILDESGIIAEKFVGRAPAGYGSYSSALDRVL